MHVGAVVAANRRSKARCKPPSKPTQTRTAQPLPGSKTPVLEDPSAPMSQDEVASYVQPYGFAAVGPLDWERLTSETPWPKLSFAVVGHMEIHEHTFYQIKCELDTKPSLSLKWGVHRRLFHLREGLHDFVRSCLGADYDVVFGQAPFARRGGLPGTSARLQAWLEQLALHINDGTALPTTVAQVLNFFAVPKPPAGATVRALLDFYDAPKPIAKVSAPFSAGLDSPSSLPSNKSCPLSFAALADSASPSRKVSFAESEPCPSRGESVFTA